MISATSSSASRRGIRPREAASSSTSCTRPRVSVTCSRLRAVLRARVVAAVPRLVVARPADRVVALACGTADFAAVRRLDAADLVALVAAGLAVDFEAAFGFAVDLDAGFGLVVDLEAGFGLVVDLEAGFGFVVDDEAGRLAVDEEERFAAGMWAPGRAVGSGSAAAAGEGTRSAGELSLFAGNRDRRSRVSRARRPRPATRAAPSVRAGGSRPGPRSAGARRRAPRR